MSLAATFDPVVSRVRLAATAVAGATTARFERSTNGLLWTTVRAGSAAPVTGGAASLDDYEFTAGAVNHYRVTGTPGAVAFTTTITPDQPGVWFKSITRPFLNREVQVVAHGDITRPARNALFPVIGRTLPVALTDVRLSRRWDMTVKADSVSDADALDLVFASGDPLLVQVPAAGAMSTIPGGYVVVEDTTRARYGVKSQRRWFTLPMVEVAPPGPGVYGLPATWETILAEFGSWNAVLATFGTWAEVADYVSDPSIVIVP